MLPIKPIKKIIAGLILLLLVVSGLVYAKRELKNETSKKPVPKPLTAAEKYEAQKKWDFSADGIMFNNWAASPAGKKIQASADKISNSIKNNTKMEAVVSSLSLPDGSRLGLAMLVNIENEDYILSFGSEESNEFEPLRSLKVNDKIIIRSQFISKAPKYAYAIVAGNYVERDSKVIYKRGPRKDGC